MLCSLQDIEDDMIPESTRERVLACSSLQLYLMIYLIIITLRLLNPLGSHIKITESSRYSHEDY